MIAVACLDTVAAVAALFTLYLIARLQSSVFSRAVKGLLLLFVLLNFVRNIGNAAEWWGISDLLDSIEEYIEMLIPIIWSLVLFSYAQGTREGELNTERTNFQAFFDAISDLAFVLDKNLEIIHVNPAAQSKLGYSRKELTQKHIRDLLAPTGPDTVNKEHARHIQVTGVSLLDCVMQTKTGESICVEMKLSQGAWNGIDAIFCVSRDITERKVMESQLRQSEKMDIIGQMAGGIAHDFNNQLLGIMGYADVLVHALKENPKHQEYAKSLQVSAKHAAEITRRLLEFARKGSVNLQAVDLHRIVQEVLSMLAHSIDKQIVIVQRLTAKRKTVMGDATQIQSAILNIALNARDAMQDGGKLTFSTDEIRLNSEQCRTLLCDIKPGVYLRLQISDTGIGMSPSTISRIFEPFFTTKEKGRGTGMGMAAVYNTMKNHNGSIAVKSEEGKGTAVSLYFPPRNVEKSRI